MYLPEASVQAQRQATPVRTPSSSVRYNLAVPQTPTASAASVSAQDGGNTRSDHSAESSPVVQPHVFCLLGLKPLTDLHNNDESLE